MSPSSTTHRPSSEVVAAVAAAVPVEVREAFDAAVAARRQFHAATTFADRRAAFTALTAANNVLSDHRRNLPQQAARVAQTGGAA
ncbi:hypothetical protein ACWF62_17570 [Rhodococcus sp. NPDC054953]